MVELLLQQDNVIVDNADKDKILTILSSKKKKLLNLSQIFFKNSIKVLLQLIKFLYFSMKKQKLKYKFYMHPIYNLDLFL